MDDLYRLPIGKVDKVVENYGDWHACAGKTHLRASLADW